MRLIDADALIKWLNDTYCDISKKSWNYNHHVMAMDMIEIIENYPTIEERKHGHWIATNQYYTGTWCALYYYKCSVCGAVILEDVDFGVGNYCQQCGAKMDEEEKE